MWGNIDDQGSERFQVLITPLEIALLTFTRQLLCLRELGGRHQAGNHVARLHRGCVARRTAKIEPHVSANKVLRDAMPLAIHQTEIGLRRRVPLCRRQSIPLQRFGVILRHTIPHTI